MIKKNRFSDKFAAKSNSELENIIGNIDYQREAQIAAAWELERRGESQETEELSDLGATENQDIEQENPQVYNVTDDPNAPELYHPRFILVYGALFSVFLAGVLLAVNLATLKKNRLAWMALLVSLFYTVAQATILNLIDRNSLLALSLSLLGIYILERIFWAKEVSGLAFRKKPIWIPLIIAIVIYAPLFYLVVSFGYE